MQYNSGQEITVGDRVLFENGRVRGAVVHIIETGADTQTWNLEEPGFMIETKELGWDFMPFAQCAEYELKYVSGPNGFSPTATDKA